MYGQIFKKDGIVSAWVIGDTEDWNAAIVQREGLAMPKYNVTIKRNFAEVTIYAHTPLALFDLVLRQRQSMDEMLDTWDEPFEGYVTLSEYVSEKTGKRYLCFVPSFL